MAFEDAVLTEIPVTKIEGEYVYLTVANFNSEAVSTEVSVSSAENALLYVTNPLYNATAISTGIDVTPSGRYIVLTEANFNSTATRVSHYYVKYQPEDTVFVIESARLDKSVTTPSFVDAFKTSINTETTEYYEPGDWVYVIGASNRYGKGYVRTRLALFRVQPST